MHKFQASNLDNGKITDVLVEFDLEGIRNRNILTIWFALQQCRYRQQCRRCFDGVKSDTIDGGKESKEKNPFFTVISLQLLKNFSRVVLSKHILSDFANYFDQIRIFEYFQLEKYLKMTNLFNRQQCRHHRLQCGHRQQCR